MPCLNSRRRSVRRFSNICAVGTVGFDIEGAKAYLVSSCLRTVAEGSITNSIDVQFWLVQQVKDGNCNGEINGGSALSSTWYLHKQRLIAMSETRGPAAGTSVGARKSGARKDKRRFQIKRHLYVHLLEGTVACSLYAFKTR